MQIVQYIHGSYIEYLVPILYHVFYIASTLCSLYQYLINEELEKNHI